MKSEVSSRPFYNSFRRGRTSFSLLAALSFLVVSSPAQLTVDKPAPSTVHIVVNANKPASFTIPRTIFGSFLEPIGDSINQGLSAEILVNPSLETGLWDDQNLSKMISGTPALARSMKLGLPLPWQPLNASAGSRYELKYGNAANSWVSLEAMGVEGQKVGIKQRVYLPAQRVLSYNGSFYAKHLAGSSGVKVEILSADGKVLASTQVAAPESAWRKYRFKLTLPKGSVHRLEPVDFAIEVEPNERVQLDELALMPDDAIDGMDPDVIALAKSMHVSLLRFGGNFTSTYDWRDGIGPEDRRVTMRNLAWGIPEYNTFGTDEFLDFCKLIGAEPQIDLNMGTGTADEAAAWARYIRQRYHGKILWELGNELWGKYQFGYPSIDQLPQLTVDFSHAVRNVDPEGKIIATGERPYDFQQWNAAQLSAPAGTFDYLSTHFIRVTNRVGLANPTADFLAAAAFALPVEAERRFKAMQIQIDGSRPVAGETRLALTEWLFSNHRNEPGTVDANSPSFQNMGGAIITAGMFNGLLRNANLVPISNMTGIMDFAGISKKRGQVYATPSYYAFQMYAAADAERPVQVAANSGEYSIQRGVLQMANIPNVPYLDVAATLNSEGNVLTLFCINRAINRDLNAEIDLKGFHPAEGYAQVLRAGTIYEGNDENDPTRVVPKKQNMTMVSSVIHHTFPHESITVITLRKK